MKKNALLLSLVPLFSGCGPYELESGQAVLMVAPLLTLIGALTAIGYRRVCRSFISDVAFSWRPSLMLIAAQILLAVLSIAVLRPEVASRRLDDWAMVALFVVGCSYLSLQLFTLRISLIKKWKKYYARTTLWPWLVLYPPALWLGFFGSKTEELGPIAGLLLFIPGYMGIVTVPLFLILLTEVVIRYKRAATARRALEPAPLPKVVVVKSDFS